MYWLLCLVQYQLGVVHLGLVYLGKYDPSEPKVRCNIIALDSVACRRETGHDSKGICPSYLKMTMVIRSYLFDIWYCLIIDSTVRFPMALDSRTCTWNTVTIFLSCLEECRAHSKRLAPVFAQDQRRTRYVIIFTFGHASIFVLICIGIGDFDAFPC